MDQSTTRRRRLVRRVKRYPPFGKKYIALLEALRHFDKNQRLALLRAADEKLINYICKCALNVIKGVDKICAETKIEKIYVKILRRERSVFSFKNVVVSCRFYSHHTRNIFKHILKIMEEQRKWF